MTPITHRDSYFRCIATQVVHYCDVPQETGWLIGAAKDERDKVEFHSPPPPLDVAKVDGYNLPKEEQYFRRRHWPKCWEREELRKIAKAKYSTGSTDKQREDPNKTNFNWWRVYENMTPEMRDYFEQEWERRNNGYWFFNNGELTWITGAHYMYLTHWWLKIGQYPIYKDRNRMDFYAWRAIEEDPACSGLLTPKHRRSNHTTIACFLGFEYVSRTPGTHFAIQSHGKNGAATDFRDKVVPGWKRLVPFFQPLSSSGDNPKESIIMEKPGRTGSKKDQYHEGEDALDSKIWFAANGNGVSEPLDGDILHRYVRDEPGKEDNLDINDQWGVMRRCLGELAKAYFCSTRESVKAPYTDAWKRMYLGSLMSDALDAGSFTTATGMRTLFIPCFVGHTMEGRVNMFTGKHGESIVNKPTPEQKKWLLENRCHNEKDREIWESIYDKGGAFEYELNKRILNKQDPAEKRRMPFNIDEVFATVNAACDFDVKRMNVCKTALESHHRDGRTLFGHLTVRGRLEWVAGIVKGNVVFIEDENGPFLWNRNYLPVPKQDKDQPRATKPKKGKAAISDGEVATRLRIWANNVEREPPRQGKEHLEKYGTVRPKVNTDTRTYDPDDQSWIVIGMDPQKLAAIDKRAKTISKAASAGFYPYRHEVDGEWTAQTEEDPDFAEDWETNAFIFQYLHHPKEPSVHHEDMLKVAIFLNAKILFESQVPTFRDYMRLMGCGSFLIGDRAWAKDKSKSVPGLASSEQVINKYVSRLTSWITRFCYANKCPFPEMIEQWMMMDPGDMERYDLGVATGYARLAAQPYELLMPQKTDNLPEQRPNAVTISSIRGSY